MLQWMGGSRRKVTTSRKSTQKRQKQYFEQRKQQQQYQHQTAGLHGYDNEMDVPEERCKGHRSLDVISMLNLSKIAQECRSSCPNGNLGVDASKTEFDNQNGSLGIQSGAVGQPSDFVHFSESRIPSTFQMETASPKKIPSSAPDSHTSALNRVNSKSDRWETTTVEKPLSVLDLLADADDKLEANTEGNIPHEVHVAFSVEGLGKVGTETPVRSPQQPSRSFHYGLSTPLKASGQLNLSNKFNSLLGDLETEVGTRMQDINFPLDSDHLDFSSDYMGISTSPRQKSFTFRDPRQLDGHTSKNNHYFDHHNEDKYDDMSPLQYTSFFDDEGPGISWKTKKSLKDDSPADNVIYRAYDPQEFSFEGNRIPNRAAEKVTEKFDILGSTSPFSKHEKSEYNRDFLVSRRSRHPTVEREFDHILGTNQPEHFSTVPEDARENSSLHSEESCSSTAVRHQKIDDSLSSATSSHCRRRRHFAGSGDKYGTKSFAKDGKIDGRTENISTRSATHTKFSDPSDSKARQQLSPLFQRNLGTEDNWFFEERHTEVDIPLERNSETKHTRFNSEQWDEDLFSKFPIPKSQSNSVIPPDSPFQTKPKDLSFAAGYMGDTLSPDISPQRSISKETELNSKLKPSSYKPLDLGEDIFIRNKTLVSNDIITTDVSNLMTSAREGREAKDQRTERLNTAFFADLVDETSPSDDSTNKPGTTTLEKERISHENGDPHGSCNKFLRTYQSGIKENMEDFGPKQKMGYRQKSGYVDGDSPSQAMMLQSYVLQLFCVQKRLKY